ncbi:hypothetical protein ABEB36_005519 [Hypothenemus hampei]
MNIYMKRVDPNANLDVLVHIHGGAFMFGRGASYGPDIIMDRDIVFVNFNYRLGPLGFLSTQDDILPGNLGLKDQIKALKWINENIKYFGGNPQSITIHGMSAGGASVHLHYLIPESKGLFKQGFSQSGCALNPWVIAENSREKTAKVADLVGCPTKNSKQIKECLKNRPARNIVQTVKEFQPFQYNPFSPFGVVVDGLWTSNAVLPEDPYNLLAKGKVLDVPWITSFTKHEGLYPASEFWANDQHLLDIDVKWNEIMPFILHYNDSVTPELKDVVSQKIREVYLGDKAINRNTFPHLVDIISDRLFVADIETSARLQNAAVLSNIYVYKFSYRGATSKSTFRTKYNEDIGVSHGDDTVYFLYALLNTTSTKNDRAMSNTLIDMTTSYMKTSQPNITNKWQPLNGNKYCLLEISGPETFNMKCYNETGRRSFWDGLPFREYGKLEETKFISDKQEL